MVIVWRCAAAGFGGIFIGVDVDHVAGESSHAMLYLVSDIHCLLNLSLAFSE